MKHYSSHTILYTFPHLGILSPNPSPNGNSSINQINFLTQMHKHTAHTHRTKSSLANMMAMMRHRHTLMMASETEWAKGYTNKCIEHLEAFTAAIFHYYKLHTCPDVGELSVQLTDRKTNTHFICNIAQFHFRMFTIHLMCFVFGGVLRTTSQASYCARSCRLFSHWHLCYFRLVVILMQFIHRHTHTQ